MGRDHRLEIAKQIEAERNAFVISYITSTRTNLQVQMAMDQPRKIYEHLKTVGPKKTNIDLLLHSNGGEATVPWRLVTLIREYSKRFSVLIPHRAFSAATLTAMGADEVIMHPMGMLGPTDPTVQNDFNPVDPTNPQRRFGISVEDVTAFLSLIKEDAGIKDEEYVAAVFSKLADKVHPLALGNVKRFLSLSRLMGKKLLALHMDEVKHRKKIQRVVDNLTSKLFFHGHPINRREAREQVGLTNVKDASPKVEKLMWDLYLDFEEEMKMDEPFQIETEFLKAFPALPAPAPGAAPTPPSLTPLTTLPVVAIESKVRSDSFLIEYQLSGEKLPNGAVNVTMITQNQGWRAI